MWLAPRGGRRYVSLAEFDSWFNQHTGRVEGGRLKNGRSALYRYARKALIRAFNLANGVATAKGSNDDDFVTRGEFRLLMVAVQSALIIYRLFDIADTSDDHRVDVGEWTAQLPAMNEQLALFGYQGEALTEEDFGRIDTDGGGQILLAEAVSFFLSMFTREEKLLHENEEESYHGASG